MKRLPLIDFSDRTGNVHAIERACSDIGFMYIVGHGISITTIQRASEAVKAYFDQPLDLKLRDRISRHNYRGYIPAGFFSANSGNGAADNYEGYKLHCEIQPDDPIRQICELYGPNKWPQAPANFEKSVLDYWHECDRIAAVLLGALARILDTPKDRFLQQFDKPLSNMTLLHYPPQAAESAAFGIHPHKDTDALTILPPDPVGGLMVRCRDEQEWIKAEPPANALTVNIGDLLELWSGGYFVSTPHKVVNSSGTDRYSFPYFSVPRFDTVVKPLIAPQPQFRRPNVHVGDVSQEVWRTNWSDVTSGNIHFDLGTLDN